MTQTVPERHPDGIAAYLLWLLALILAWPIALLALIIYPVVWLVALPFRSLAFR